MQKEIKFPEIFHKNWMIKRGTVHLIHSSILMWFHGFTYLVNLLLLAFNAYALPTFVYVLILITMGCDYNRINGAFYRLNELVGK